MVWPPGSVKVSFQLLTVEPPVLVMVRLFVRPLFHALTDEVTLQPEPPGGLLVGLLVGVRVGDAVGDWVGGGLVPVGATARPVLGEIMPAHRLRLARPAAICGMAATV